MSLSFLWSILLILPSSTLLNLYISENYRKTRGGQKTNLHLSYDVQVYVQYIRPRTSTQFSSDIR